MSQKISMRSGETRKVRNILFIMCDQLRADYLSCYGQSVLRTANIDALAAKAVRFTRAYVQAGVCGPSRMSYYTGRYPLSHGATWNFIPLPIAEVTLGQYLEEAGRSIHLVGKTHFEPDREGMGRMGIDAQSDAGKLLREGGFRIVARHEGDLPTGKQDYQNYLGRVGYQSPDPWLDYAVGAYDENGQFVSGWKMRNAHLAARVAEEHSETAYVTTKAIDFIRSQGERPWALHLSYIKPHWPYIAPAPYHQMFRHADTGTILPSDSVNEHPVITAFREHPESRSFSREEVARHVRPTYMGLIKQIDDHLGRVFKLLEETGRMDDTLIIFTSDHGDFLGDRKLGEKELFYEEIQRVPFIIYDPDSAADNRRGQIEERLVEAVDVLPTILDALSIDIPMHRLEGCSLLPMTRSQGITLWRQFAVSEIDYVTRKARRVLKRTVNADCRAWMIRSESWKYVHWAGYRPQLFNLDEDPQELVDLATDSTYNKVCSEHRDMLLQWMLSRKRRTAIHHSRLEYRTDNLPPGIYIGEW